MVRLELALLTALACTAARLAAAQEAPPEVFPQLSEPPAGPPPVCQQILVLRDETVKNGTVLSSPKAKSDPVEACRLFKPFLASETELIQRLEQHQAECGVPDEAIKRIRSDYTKAMQISKQVCDVAAQSPRNLGPSLSDVLNSAPTLPKASSSWPLGDYPVHPLERLRAPVAPQH